MTTQENLLNPLSTLTPPTIKHFGSIYDHRRYCVLASFKSNSVYTPVAVFHYSQYSNALGLVKKIIEARQIIYADVHSSATITGTPFPEYSIRWFASHNLNIEIFDMTQPPPRKTIFQRYFKAPYLEYIENTTTTNDTTTTKRK